MLEAILQKTRKSIWKFLSKKMCSKCWKFKKSSLGRLSFIFAKRKLVLFICIRLILIANIWLLFVTKEFQTKEELVEDLYTYIWVWTHAFDFLSNVNAPAIYVSTDNICDKQSCSVGLFSIEPNEWASYLPGLCVRKLIEIDFSWRSGNCCKWCSTTYS